MVVTYHQYRETLAELQRVNALLIGGVRTNKAKYVATVSRSTANSLQIDLERSTGASSAIISYIRSLTSIVQSYRTSLRTPDWGALAQHRIVGAEKARHYIRLNFDRDMIVFCTPVSDWVASGRSIRVSLLWERNVRDRGMGCCPATGVIGGKVFISKVKRKPSAFLGDMGVELYDAVGAALSPKTETDVEGYVFRHPAQNDNVVCFHKDFNMGVRMIKRLIEERVMGSLMPEKWENGRKAK